MSKKYRHKKLKPFGIKVRFSPRIRNGGLVYPPQGKGRTYEIIVWSRSSYVRIFLNVVHECIHVAFYELIRYIMPDHEFSITREHFIIDKVDVLLRRLVMEHLVKFKRIKKK